MSWSTDDLMNTPQYWGTTLPQAGSYNGDLQAYLDDLKKTQAADPNNSGLAFARPSTYTAPDGQTMSMAGYHGNETAGQVAADGFNRIMQSAVNNTAGGDANALMALYSRMKVNPDSAQAAYNAYTLNPDTGLPTPVLNDAVINIMEKYGMRPTPSSGGGPGNMPGTQTPGDTKQHSMDGSQGRAGRGGHGQDGSDLHGRRGRDLTPISSSAGSGRTLTPISSPAGDTTPKPANPSAIARAGDPRVADSVSPYDVLPSNLTTIHPDYPDFILKWMNSRRDSPPVAMKGY